MGIHDRDYYRDSGRGMFDAWGRQGVTVWLIVVTAVAGVAQLATRNLPGGGAEGALGYDPARVLAGEVWRLLSYALLSAGLLSLVFNMLVLYWAGSRLEARYGGTEFLVFYLLAGLTGGLATFVLQLAGLEPAAALLGATGPITAVLVLYACHYPREQILVMFVIPMPVWLVVILYVGLGAIGAFGADNAAGSLVYSARLTGALFGFVYYKTGIRIASVWPSWPTPARRRPAPRLRVVPVDPADVADGAETPVAAAPPEDGLEAQVDAVLAKVSAHGQDSLTPEERAILFRAREVYKKRRK